MVVAQRLEQAIAPWVASGVPYHPNQDDLILSCALFFKAHVRAEMGERALRNCGSRFSAQWCA